MPSVNVRLPDDLNERMMKQVTKLDCTKSDFVIEAIAMAVERNEKESRHVPIAVKRAMPQRTPTGMVMPEGVIFDRWPNG